MRIFCIGRNYRAHALELKNEVPTQPVIFMKPESALVKNAETVAIPEFTKDMHHELEIVLMIAKTGKNITIEDADNYYENLSLGLDFTARDVQTELKQKGLPWELAKSFDGSAVVGLFVDKKEAGRTIRFQLKKNGAVVQDGNTEDMIFSFGAIVAFVSKYFALQPGDLIFTGTPAGVGPLHSGDKLEGYMNGQKLLEAAIK